ncbi:nuclear cap-binding protein subunit 3 isoform X2 [Amblyraja radiata]|uniref:nuclear cap-binding protein subunit 3 isoform X2 n=1 Tax=Amblyraja radiata TaxID=386614 RepID=UPI001401C023|nr:nuclear cap-binding protein subunit 3 isoform X2 [Amblyraja radiata]
MAAVRGLRVCVEAEAGEAAGDAASASASASGSGSGSGSGSASASASDSGSGSGSGSGSESESEREEEPMEVEEGEIETEKLDSIAVRRSLKDLVPDTSRRYENITGTDVTSKEAVERKEQRARRFHFRAEVNVTQRKVVLDKEILKEAIPKIRLEALHVTGVEEMSTEEIFAYFKEYPPSSIEWIDDSSCNVVWLDDVTAARAIVNLSVGADAGNQAAGDAKSCSKKQEGSNEHGPAERTEEEEEEGELEKEPANTAEVECKPAADTELDTLSQEEQEVILRNELRPAIRTPQGNKLQVRFATRDDRKEHGAARRSQYYMKYGNPNYGGMKGILSNSWKKRYHARRTQRDVLKRKSFLPDEVELESHYEHHRSGLGNVPEEPIQEEEEDEDETEQDMEADDRVVVEYRNESRTGPSSPHASDSDEMDYDLELKMISMPSPKKSLKMTMYADEVEARLKTIRNSIRPEVSVPAVPNVKNRIGARLSTEKVSDVRLLLEEKRQLAERQQPSAASSSATGVRQRLGKRPLSPQSSSVTVSRREPQTDVHSRLGIPKHDGRSFPQDKPKKTGDLWSRLGKVRGKGEKSPEKEADKEAPAEKVEEQGETVEAEEKEEDGDTALQRAWGALIREKERSHKKSRLDNLPSLQIEISRESSTSDSES